MSAGEVGKFPCPFCLQPVTASVVDGQLTVEHRAAETCEVFSGASPFEYLRCVNRMVMLAQLRRPKASA